MSHDCSGVFVVSYIDSDQYAHILGVYTTFDDAQNALFTKIDTEQDHAIIERYELNSEKVTATWTYHPIVSPVWTCTSEI